MKGALPESCQIDNAPLPPVRVLSLANSPPCYLNPPPLTAHVPVVQPVIRVPSLAHSSPRPPPPSSPHRACAGGAARHQSAALRTLVSLPPSTLLPSRRMCQWCSPSECRPSHTRPPAPLNPPPLTAHVPVVQPVIRVPPLAHSSPGVPPSTLLPSPRMCRWCSPLEG